MRVKERKRRKNKDAPIIMAEVSLRLSRAEPKMTTEKYKDMLALNLRHRMRIEAWDMNVISSLISDKKHCYMVRKKAADGSGGFHSNPISLAF